MKRVLIVDDSLDLARLIQTALARKEADIQIAVYISGEEALLDSFRNPVDVLITDIRLAGMSGLDLVSKIRKRYPGIRVIVMTGMQDNSLQKKATELGVDAFFRKPMNLPALLEAVNACLKGESRQIVPAAPAVATPEAPAPPEVQNLPAQMPDEVALSSLITLLAGLRSDLGALAALLLDKNGQVLAKSGNFPDPVFETRWSESLLLTVRATIRVSKLLGSSLPRNLVALQGQAFDLVLSPVGSYALVLALRTGRPSLRLGLAFDEILTIQKNLLALLPPESPAVSLAETKPSPAPASSAPETRPTVALKPDPIPPAVAPRRPRQAEEPVSEDFVALFHQSTSLDSQDVEAFWETASGARSSAGPQTPGSDAITYEQARKMGLAPGLEDDQG